jgi:protein-S-isoprenylcysteine O-methyltransferase Ste14
MAEQKIGIKDMITVLFKREFYLDMAVFMFVCVPAVLIVLYFSIKADNVMGFRAFTGMPYNIALFFILSAAGAVIIWAAYTYLVVAGEGSPCPQLGGTKKLVKSGPYGIVRHPSVIGKLLGVIGLGCLSGSVFFTFFVIPVLFIWSVFYNRFIQEKGCVERFGEDYLRYRKTVPMFIPKRFREREKII